jgi:preprotein translocase subunit SecE
VSGDPDGPRKRPGPVSNQGTDRVKKLTERLKIFLKEVRLEMSKVTWPTRAELKDSTIVVIVSCLVISAFIGAVDWVLYSLVRLAF